MSTNACEGDAVAVEAVNSVTDGVSGAPVKELAAEDIESSILAAMRARDTFLRENSDSFTFESVRRLLEEDLGLSKYSLDVHKSFIRRHLVQCLEGEMPDYENGSEKPRESDKNDMSTSQEANELSKGNKLRKDSSEGNSKDEKMEDSPVMGLLVEEKKAKVQVGEGTEKEIPESRIKQALMKRASYIQANSEKITMSSLRRLLEKDLKIDKLALDPYKKVISKQLDEVMKSLEAPKSVQAKDKDPKKLPNSKGSRRKRKEAISEASDGEEEKSESEKISKKRRLQKPEGLKKKGSKEAEISTKKRRKDSEKEDESDDNGSDKSNDDQPQSSADKRAKKKETPTLVSGKRVEHLKSIIKSCGMSVYPSIYRKVKQAPEDRREAFFIKELEQILAKEGLSPNPSEKEIKDVRKRKEREKELEGIDMSNIVTSSRRRSTASFAPPPKPQVTEETESEDSDNSDDDDDDDDEADEDQVEDQEDGEDVNEDQEEEEGNLESQSRELDEGNEQSCEEGYSKEAMDVKNVKEEDVASKVTDGN